MTRDARTSALQRVPLRPNLDLINHKPEVRVPEDRPRSQDRVIRRWPDGSLDYGTALYGILDALWKLREGGHLTPIEAALVSIVLPQRGAQADPAASAVTLGRLSGEEKRRLGELVAQKLEQILMASTQQVLARSATNWDLAGVREHLPTILVNDPYGLGTAKPTASLAKGAVGPGRPEVHGDLHVARFQDALKTAQTHHQSGNFHGAHAALQVAGQALSQVPDEHALFSEPHFPATFQHLLSMHRDVSAKLGSGADPGVLQNALPRVANLLKAYEGDREGEGTRGGVVVGHRQSGEPIYQSQIHRLAPELQRLLEEHHAHAARSDDPAQRVQAGIQGLAAAFFHHHAGDSEAAERALTFAEHHQGRARGSGHDSQDLAWLERHLPAVRSLVGPRGPGTITTEGHVVTRQKASGHGGHDLARSLRVLRDVAVTGR